MAHDDPLQEASDPTTDPERLRNVADHKNEDVRRAAWRNPSLPEDVWRLAFLEGEPEAWANPMAPFYVLTWTSEYEQGDGEVANSARWATEALMANTKRCSPEGKALLASKVQEWWATSASARNMMRFLVGWAKANGDGSTEHREVMRIVVLCVRTVPHLRDDDLQALDLLEAWSQGGEDRRKEALSLAFATFVTDAALFSRGPLFSSVYTINNLLRSLISLKETERMLADVIRRARPLPPVVE